MRFAEQPTGYLATRHGWVQSYGSRYVRPPILAGDVSRPEPITLADTARQVRAEIGAAQTP